ncbi:cyclic nucleotide-binding domain protein (macronuclear) [Tetrahymena thermophila SB210]|uniref:Cyclic nucleotide-binding domain protein n=1 Tax=Tetrahymena thermophila (strain SB210) TaxID=312017 RepID=Q24C49_TETTS|nr:cyclic nucleotide-binding domain protein [Tetrahymena thermophila SB210]EAS05389.2 cyclic nucleotide-binding domain protein [Tetrahymena thermophila SB210]|eukprot:XP_001025634.2 cyclic nucleotide-binding domain protein [Tetrahymena thermophila SB210]
MNQKIYLYTGELQKRKEIAVYYLKKKAFYDFVPLMVIFVPFYYQISQLYQILQFLKIRNLSLEIFEIQFQLCVKVKKYYLVQLINLIIKLFLLAHFVSSLWYLLGQVEIKYFEQEYTWYEDSIGQDGTWWKLYLASMYWTLTLMATGSNESKTVLQTFFTTFTMLFTNIAFAYILSVIGIILSEMEQGEEDKRKDVSIINKYMRKRYISNNLQARVNLDLENYYQTNFKQEQIQNLGVLEKISADLKESLIKEYNKKILNKIPFLNSIFSDKIIEQASFVLDEKYIFPNQEIKLENDQNDFFLIYVIQGQIESYYNLCQDKTNSIQKYKQGDIIGQYSFFTGTQIEQQFKSTEFTKIMILSRNSFIEIVKKQDQEFEKFSEIKDRLLLYSQYKVVNLKCDICKQSSHFIQFCPFISINREQFNRKRFIYGNSLCIQKYVKQFAQDLIKSMKHHDKLIEDSILSQMTLIEEDTLASQNENIQEQPSKENQSQLENQSICLIETNPKLRTIITNNNVLKNENKILSQKVNSEDEESSQIDVKSLQKNDSLANEKSLLSFIDPIISIKSGQDILQNKSRKESLERDIILTRQKKESNDFFIYKAEQSLSQIEEKNDKSLQFKTKINQKLQRNSINNIKQTEIIGSIQTDMQNIKSLQQQNSNLRQLIESLIKNQNTQYKYNSFQNYKTINSTQYLLQRELVNEYNPFYFESLKDYQFYFPESNSKILIPKYQKDQKKKLKPIKKQYKMHDNQSNFIKYHQTISAKKVQDRYICEEESVWSDPDISNKFNAKQVDIQNVYQLHNESELKQYTSINKQIQEMKDKQGHLDKQYEKQQTINRLKTLSVQRKQQASINNSTFQQGLNQNSFLSKNEQQAVVEDDDNYMLNGTIKIYQIQGPLTLLSKQFISTIWVVEIVLNTNQKVYLFSEELQDRKEITLFYLKKKALYDFIPLLIIFISFQFELCMKVKKYYLVQLFNLILKLFLLAHVISSLWYLLGQIELNYLQEESTWYDGSIGQDGTWWKLYLASMYWTLTLMATGSNESKTVLQTFFTTFTMLFTNIAFAYILNVIGIILTEMEQGEQDKRKNVSIINEYMRKRHISNNLKARVNLDLEHYYQKNFKQEQIQNMEVLDKVSADLKESLILEYNKKILHKIQFLDSVFSSKIIEQASLILKEQYFFPNQIINLEKDQHDFFLIYVLEGKIESYINGSQESKNQNVIQKFKKGDTVGQYSFFTGIQSNQYLKSTDFTKLMILSRNSLLEIIQKHEKEFQKFNEIKDKLLLYNQHKIINLECNICKQSSHFTIFCPNICMNKKPIYQQIQFSEKQNQERNEFQRKTLFRGNSLIFQKQIKQITKDFIKQMIQNDNFFEGSNLNQLTSQEETQTTQNEDIEQNHSPNANQQIYEDHTNFFNETNSKLKSIVYTNNNPYQKNESRAHQRFNSDYLEDEQNFQVETRTQQKNDQQTIDRSEKQQNEYSSDMKSQIDRFQRNPSIEKDMISSKQKKECNDDNFIIKSDQYQGQIDEIDKSLKFIKKNAFKSMNTSKNSLVQLEPHGNSLKDIQNQQQLSKLNTFYRELIDLIIQQQKISFRTSTTNQNQKTNNSVRDLQIDQQNPFLLDCLKDYQYYFPEGNSKIVIPRFQKAQLKKTKAFKKQMKSFKANSNQTFSH